MYVCVLDLPSSNALGRNLYENCCFLDVVDDAVRGHVRAPVRSCVSVCTPSYFKGRPKKSVLANTICAGVVCTVCILDDVSQKTLI